MARSLIINIALLMTFDMYMFFNGKDKYRGYLDFNHYIQTLKMPIYQKVLMYKIVIVIFLTALFNIIF